MVRGVEILGIGLVCNALASDDLATVWCGRLGKDVVDAMGFAFVVVFFADIGVFVAEGVARVVGVLVCPCVDELGLFCNVLNGWSVGGVVEVAHKDGWEVAGVLVDVGCDFLGGADAALLAEREVGVKEVEAACTGLDLGA